MTKISTYELKKWVEQVDEWQVANGKRSFALCELPPELQDRSMFFSAIQRDYLFYTKKHSERVKLWDVNRSILPKYIEQKCIELFEAGISKTKIKNSIGINYDKVCSILTDAGLVT